MPRTGVKVIQTLRKYVNGVKTSETKTNTISDEDYIQQYYDFLECVVRDEDVDETTTAAPTTAAPTTASPTTAAPTTAAPTTAAPTTSAPTTAAPTTAAPTTAAPTTAAPTTAAPTTAAPTTSPPTTTSTTVQPTFTCTTANFSMVRSYPGVSTSGKGSVSLGTITSISPSTYTTGSATYTATITVPSGYTNSGQSVTCTTTVSTWSAGTARLIGTISPQWAGTNGSQTINSLCGNNTFGFTRYHNGSNALPSVGNYLYNDSNLTSKYQAQQTDSDGMFAARIVDGPVIRVRNSDSRIISIHNCS